jgi:hypothetical protein
MSASDHLSPQQFASTQDLVWKYDKTDTQPEPMEGIRGESRGRDWKDLVQTKMDYDPGHSVEMLESVGRHGVRQPIGIDRRTTPPTVTDGHTRLMAAWALGQRRVPVRDLPVGQAENKSAPRHRDLDDDLTNGDGAAWDRIPNSARGV